MPYEYIREDYVHSANSLFHFMTSSEYLTEALKRKALCPRYCIENVEYLNIRMEEESFGEIAVLQKCFCDIPLHNITKKFPIQLTDNNNLTDDQLKTIPKEYSHPELYGKYAIAFSKKWGEENKLQPIHYLSEDAFCVTEFSKLFNMVLSEENVSDEISDSLLNWLSFIKPLRGRMKRRYETDSQEKIEFEVFKNFHDEHEWRYVPFNLMIEGQEIDTVIANKDIINNRDLLTHISNMIERYKVAWIPFNYEDIRYIIVPDASGRIEIIKSINELEETCFGKDNELIQRSLLISRILVLDDIEKDF